MIASVSKADTGGKKRGLRVWNLGVPVLKLEFYRWLKLDKPTDEELADGGLYPHGYCHFPEYGEEYFKQITSERRVIKLVKGFPKASWEKDPYVRNEALDCRVYARAAASIYGIDRFDDKKWNMLERALGEQVSAGNKAPEPNPKFKLKPNIQKVNDPYL